MTESPCVSTFRVGEDFPGGPANARVALNYPGRRSEITISDNKSFSTYAFIRQVSNLEAKGFWWGSMRLHLGSGAREGAAV